MWQKPYVCVDLETTGVLPEKNEIIEIGAVRIENGRITDSFQQFVKPKRRVPPFIFKLTQINPDQLKSAPAFSEVYEQLLDFIGDATFIAHSVDFDFGMINQSLMRLGKEPIRNPQVDTQDLATLLLPQLSSHKLSNLADHYQIHFPDKHRALADAQCTAEVFLNMLEELKALHPIVLRDSIATLPPKYQGLIDLLKHYYSHDIIGESLDYKTVLAPSRQPKKATNTQLPTELSSAQILKAAIPNYEKRPNQETVITTITEAFSSPHHALIEAGTGSGKSMAYLIPSLLTTLREEVPIIISTKTKHLQRQLYDQEIPRLEKALDQHFSAVIVKGRDNYADVTRFDTLYRQLKTGALTQHIMEALGLLSWLIQTETGDLSELHPNIWNHYAERIRFTGLTLSKSPKHCLLQHVRRQVKTANLVITNHALLFSDHLNDANILPDSPYVICDEAHAIEDVLTQALTLDYSDYSFTLITNAMEGHISDLEQGQDQEKNRLEPHIDTCHAHHHKLLIALAKCAAEGPVNLFQLPVDETRMLSPHWREANEEKDQLISSINTLIAILKQGEEDCDLTLLDSLEQFTERIHNLFELSKDSITWLEYSKTPSLGTIHLKSAPVTVEEIIQDSLFSTKRSCILLSATLRIQNSFDYIMKRTGLIHHQDRVQTLALPSDFDYSKQAVWAVPENPDPLWLSDMDALSECITDIIAAFRGRSLVLLTAKATLDKVFKKVRNLLNNRSIQLLCQGRHGSRESIIEKFKKYHNEAAIFGVDSFWEGVDIQGNALQCVIIGKLPFPVPTEPLHQARIKAIEEAGGNGFIEYMVPTAILKFKQGIGRLIRSKSDTGVLFVLDPRILTKSYGRYFQEELKQFQRIEAPIEQLMDKAILPSD